ncbi:YkvA family protein [Bacillus marinisedimentorum]|uniref:YkvA family protein n=1 Tax=Bacillus marinisedimentorum TaxID=1821260 RepID=UPI0007E0FD9D|nr:YkvA family protein [Bacillus marinisedimentorum]
MIAQLKAWAKQLKKQIFILYFAYKDKRTPWFARLFTTLVVAYAFSPIDLIPDFIPVLGYLDDILLVPTGIYLALKMIPEHVIADCREQADELMAKGKPKNWIAGTIIILLWTLVLTWLFIEAYQIWNR